jgi:hypothetical protein
MRRCRRYKRSAPIVSIVVLARLKRLPNAWRCAVRAGRIGWGRTRGARALLTNNDKPCRNAVAVSLGQTKVNRRRRETRGRLPLPAGRASLKIGKHRLPKSRQLAALMSSRVLGWFCARSPASSAIADRDYHVSLKKQPGAVDAISRVNPATSKSGRSSNRFDRYDLPSLPSASRSLPARGGRPSTNSGKPCRTRSPSRQG